MFFAFSVARLEERGVVGILKNVIPKNSSLKYLYVVLVAGVVFSVITRENKRDEEFCTAASDLKGILRTLQASNIFYYNIIIQFTSKESKIAKSVKRQKPLQES